MSDDEQNDELFKASKRIDEKFDAPPSLPTQAVPVVDEPLLRFSNDDGALPHWTEPPTGQMPAVLADDAGKADASVSAWSGFGNQAPVWRDDKLPTSSPSNEADFSYLDDGERPGALDESPLNEDPFAEEARPAVSLLDRGAATQARATDDTGRVGKIKAASARPDTRSARPGAAPAGATSPGPAKKPTDPRRPARPEAARAATTATVARGSRNMGAAVGVGIALLAVFGIAAKLGPGFVLALVVAVLSFAAVEFYDTVRRQGYQPATLLGIVAVAALPIAAYFRQSEGITVVLALAMLATLVLFMTSGSIESNPLPNTAATMLGIVYIGLLGSFAGLMLGWFDKGTNTIIALVVGTVAYDVGGLFVGGGIGKKTLVDWISPSKTWEGLIGGALAAFLAVFVLCKFGHLAPWKSNTTQILQLALVVAVAAPLGDLAESMLKRSLGVKDFGNILPGHGGVLDRFDCYLFTLPAVYFLCRILNVY